MAKALNFFRQVYRHHLGKIFVAIACALIFFILLFPLKDLSGWLSNEVAAATQDQLFLESDDIGFSFLPYPGLVLSNVSVDLVQWPTLTASRLILRPGMRALLLQPDLSADAEGLFRGDLHLELRPQHKMGSVDGSFQEIVANYQSFDLQAIGKAFSLPVPILGQASLNLDATIDPDFKNQPLGQTNFIVQNLRFLAGSVPTMMGPLSTPPLQFSQTTLQSRLVNGDLIIDKAQLGSAQDPLSLHVQGHIGLQLTKRGMTVVPEVGSYDLSVEIIVQKEGQAQLGGLATLFSFIDRFKNNTLNGTRYAFRAQGEGLDSPPDLSALTR